MPRSVWVYPEDGSPPYEKGSRPDGETRGGVMFVPDLPDFVSPIDGKRYSGRAGMREHCKVHDVVPNAELKGLPTMTTNTDFRSSEQKRASADHRKQMVINEVNKHYR